MRLRFPLKMGSLAPFFVVTLHGHSHFDSRNTASGVVTRPTYPYATKIPGNWILCSRLQKNVTIQAE
jgi:hypothetical protein